ncbi:MAG: hypothetical protein WD768_01290 [Phycisphaeraceae bacterium]
MRTSVAILLVAFLAACGDQMPATSPQSPAAAPPAPVALTLSKETTYLLGPLRANGFVDYVQAFEKVAGEGVTAQSNAAALLIEAQGPLFFTGNARQIVCGKLGIAVPAEKECLVELDDLIDELWKKLVPDLKEDPAVPPEELEGEALGKFAYKQNAREQQGIAVARPWSPREFPLIRAWIERNEAPLKIVKQASLRSHLFIPSPHGADETTMSGMFLPAVGRHRLPVRLLTARAMMRVQQGDHDGAWDDLQTCQRLTNLVSREPTFVHHLIAVSMESLLHDPLRRMVIEQSLSQAQLKRMLTEFASLSERESFLRSLDLDERFTLLDLVSRFKAKGYEGIMVPFDDDEEVPDLGAAERERIDELLDVNLVMKRINARSDDQAHGCSLPTFAERMKYYSESDARAHMLNERLMALMPDRRDEITARAIERNMKLPVEKRREAFSDEAADTLIAYGNRAIISIARGEEIARMNRDLTHITLALAAFRADRGDYPAALAELSPEYLAQVPLDRFTDMPLRYARGTNGFLLYSVGMNQRDDGGAYQVKGEDYFADIAVRVKDGKVVPPESE